MATFMVLCLLPEYTVAGPGATLHVSATKQSWAEISVGKSLSLTPRATPKLETYYDERM